MLWGRYAPSATFMAAVLCACSRYMTANILGTSQYTSAENIPQELLREFDYLSKQIQKSEIDALSRLSREVDNYSDPEMLFHMPDTIWVSHMPHFSDESREMMNITMVTELPDYPIRGIEGTPQVESWQWFKYNGSNYLVAAGSGIKLYQFSSMDYRTWKSSEDKRTVNLTNVVPLFVKDEEYREHVFLLTVHQFHFHFELAWYSIQTSATGPSLDFVNGVALGLKGIISGIHCTRGYRDFVTILQYANDKNNTRTHSVVYYIEYLSNTLQLRYIDSIPTNGVISMDSYTEEEKVVLIFANHDSNSIDIYTMAGTETHFTLSQSIKQTSVVTVTLLMHGARYLAATGGQRVVVYTLKKSRFEVFQEIDATYGSAIALKQMNIPGCRNGAGFLVQWVDQTNTRVELYYQDFNNGKFEASNSLRCQSQSSYGNSFECFSARFPNLEASVSFMFGEHTYILLADAYGPNTSLLRVDSRTIPKRSQVEREMITTNHHSHILREEMISFDNLVEGFYSKLDGAFPLSGRVTINKEMIVSSNIDMSELDTQELHTDLGSLPLDDMKSKVWDSLKSLEDDLHDAESLLESQMKGMKDIFQAFDEVLDHLVIEGNVNLTDVKTFDFLADFVGPLPTSQSLEDSFKRINADVISGLKTIRKNLIVGNLHSSYFNNMALSRYVTTSDEQLMSGALTFKSPGDFISISVNENIKIDKVDFSEDLALLNSDAVLKGFVQFSDDLEADFFHSDGKIDNIILRDLFDGTLKVSGVQEVIGEKYISLVSCQVLETDSVNNIFLPHFESIARKDHNETFYQPVHITGNVEFDRLSAKIVNGVDVNKYIIKANQDWDAEELNFGNVEAEEVETPLINHQDSAIFVTCHGNESLTGEVKLNKDSYFQLMETLADTEAVLPPYLGENKETHYDNPIIFNSNFKVTSLNNNSRWLQEFVLKTDEVIKFYGHKSIKTLHPKSVNVDGMTNSQNLADYVSLSAAKPILGNLTFSSSTVFNNIKTLGLFVGINLNKLLEETVKLSDPTLAVSDFDDISVSSFHVEEMFMGDRVPISELTVLSKTNSKGHNGSLTLRENLTVSEILTQSYKGPFFSMDLPVLDRRRVSLSTPQSLEGPLNFDEIITFNNIHFEKLNDYLFDDILEQSQNLSLRDYLKFSIHIDGLSVDDVISIFGINDTPLRNKAAEFIEMSSPGIIESHMTFSMAPLFANDVTVLHDVCGVDLSDMLDDVIHPKADVQIKGIKSFDNIPKFVNLNTDYLNGRELKLLANDSIEINGEYHVKNLVIRGDVRSNGKMGDLFIDSLGYPKLTSAGIKHIYKELSINGSLTIGGNVNYHDLEMLWPTLVHVNELNKIIGIKTFKLGVTSPSTSSGRVNGEITTTFLDDLVFRNGSQIKAKKVFVNDLTLEDLILLDQLICDGDIGGPAWRKLWNYHLGQIDNSSWPSSLFIKGTVDTISVAADKLNGMSLSHYLTLNSEQTFKLNRFNNVTSTRDIQADKVHSLYLPKVQQNSLEKTSRKPVPSVKVVRDMIVAGNIVVNGPKDNVFSNIVQLYGNQTIQGKKIFEDAAFLFPLNNTVNGKSKFKNIFVNNYNQIIPGKFQFQDIEVRNDIAGTFTVNTVNIKDLMNRALDYEHKYYSTMDKFLEPYAESCLDSNLLQSKLPPNSLKHLSSSIKVEFNGSVISLAQNQNRSSLFIVAENEGTGCRDITHIYFGKDYILRKSLRISSAVRDILSFSANDIEVVVTNGLVNSTCPGIPYVRVWKITEENLVIWQILKVTASRMAAFEGILFLQLEGQLLLFQVDASNMFKMEQKIPCSGEFEIFRTEKRRLIACINEGSMRFFTFDGHLLFVNEFSKVIVDKIKMVSIGNLILMFHLDHSISTVHKPDRRLLRVFELKDNTQLSFRSIQTLSFDHPSGIDFVYLTEEEGTLVVVENCSHIHLLSYWGASGFVDEFHLTMCPHLVKSLKPLPSAAGFIILGLAIDHELHLYSGRGYNVQPVSSDHCGGLGSIESNSIALHTDNRQTTSSLQRTQPDQDYVNLPSSEDYGNYYYEPPMYPKPQKTTSTFEDFQIRMALKDAVWGVGIIPECEPQELELE